jgi:hypothetical protein
MPAGYQCASSKAVLQQSLTTARQCHTLARNRMSKEQFWTLNGVGGVCALLLLINLVLGRLNEQSNRELVGNQNQLNRAQQMQTMMQNLAIRVAQVAQTNAALAAVLKRQDLKVTLNNPDGPTKPTP